MDLESESWKGIPRVIASNPLQCRNYLATESGNHDVSVHLTIQLIKS